MADVGYIAKSFKNFVKLKTNVLYYKNKVLRIMTKNYYTYTH